MVTELAVQTFKLNYMFKIPKFDLLVYRLFRWRWNPIFMQHPELARVFAKEINEKLNEYEQE